MVTILAGLFVLTVVVAFHEFAHLLIAKLNGVKVRRYSIGFGPVLFSKVFGGTEYCVSLLPLGGYVKLAGHGESEEECKHNHQSELFSSKSVWQRMAIAAAGPVSNYILALGIFISLYFFAGTPIITSKIMEVVENSPAMQAGIRKGDIILEVNKKLVENWEQVAPAIQSVPNDEDLVFLINRNNQQLEIKLIKLKSGPIGIKGGEQIFKDPYQPINSIKKGASYLYFLNTESVSGFKKMFQGKVRAQDSLAGPIAIVSLSGEMLRMGFYVYILWIGMISFAVGFMNFLPIPVVDGGHIAFMLLEVVRGKPLNPKVEEAIMSVGVLLLISLALFSLYFDISRLVNK